MRRILMLLTMSVALLAAPTAEARIVPLFTVHARPNTARVIRPPHAPTAYVTSASWWRYAPRFPVSFTATVDYDTTHRNIGLTCRGGAVAIIEVEAVNVSEDALVECTGLAPRASLSPLPTGHRIVIIGPAARRDRLDGWPLPNWLGVRARGPLLINVTVICQDTSAATLGLVP